MTGPSAREGRPSRFKLSEYLDSLSYPVGTALAVNFKRVCRRDIDDMFLENPSGFYRALVEVYGGDEESAIIFLKLLAASINERFGIELDPTEFAEAIKRGDRSTILNIVAVFESKERSKQEEKRKQSNDALNNSN